MVRKLLKKISDVVTGRATKKAAKKKAAPLKSTEPAPVKGQASGRKRRPGGKKSGGKKGSGRPPRSRKATPEHGDWTVDQFVVPEKEGEARFHDLEIPDRVMHAISDLGFEYCTPIQAKALTHASWGQNVAGRAQTGTGKTAAFLISILSRFLCNPIDKRPHGTPRALILAPTRELVIQIVKDCEDLGKYCDVTSMAVYGGMDYNKQADQLRDGVVDIIAATPGRLLDFCRKRVINLKHVEVLVIDEADRMLDMGFIPDVSSIIRQTPPKAKRRTMLFSATLTDDVLRLASQWMPDPVICEIEPDQVAVDTVEQIVYIVTSRNKFALLYNMLKQRPGERVLIFGNRRDRTQYLASNLKHHGIPCELLTGAVDQKKRLRILEDFKAGKIKVMVATDVAGRGLHVDDITLVVNYEFPYEPEDYVHRIGRTGRAGVEGTAVSFACEDESFIIPEIEKYLGDKLNCKMPEEELLEHPPKPEGRAPQIIREKPAGRGGGRGGPRSGGGSRGGPRGGGRGGGGRRR